MSQTRRDKKQLDLFHIYHKSLNLLVLFFCFYIHIGQIRKVNFITYHLLKMWCITRCLLHKHFMVLYHILKCVLHKFSMVLWHILKCMLHKQSLVCVGILKCQFSGSLSWWCKNVTIQTCTIFHDQFVSLKFNITYLYDLLLKHL